MVKLFLHVYVRVKFRAFGITFGVVERSWVLDIDSVLPSILVSEQLIGTRTPLLEFNERGVLLTVALSVSGL